MKRREVSLIVDSSRIEVEVLDSVLEHAFPVTSELLEGGPHTGFLVPARDHQFVSKHTKIYHLYRSRSRARSFFSFVRALASSISVRRRWHEGLGGYLSRRVRITMPIHRSSIVDLWLRPRRFSLSTVGNGKGSKQ